jgi:hypothetical protein
MVKNWGACGSMAPPITVDIIISVLLGVTRRQVRRISLR